MRTLWLPGALLIPLAVLAVLPAQAPPIKQATHIVPANPPVGQRARGPSCRRRRSRSSTARPRALEWLKRTNKPDGRFVYGFQPSLRVQLDGDNFLSQAGAAFALARAARYFRDDAGTATARQAILTLLLETMTDPSDPSIRFTAAPPQVLNRLSSHGMLISAINELAKPEDCKDLLDQADQLANYLKRQQRLDGSLGTGGFAEVEGAGLALQGIIRSHKHRPAAWKLDLVRKARGYYQPHWQENKNLATVVNHTPAYAEVYLLTKDAGCKDAVFAMNDWLLGLQFSDDFDSSRKQWTGGFPRFQDGKQASGGPDISSAAAAESLAEACRVAKAVGDLDRMRKYEQALSQNLGFLMSLQYTSAKTQHFVEAFRPSILGAFHASHQDGNLKLDYTQHPLSAMVQYLDTVIE